MKEIVIVGGGVAGLSALNRLADLGVRATLIEAGSYPSHKVCGEFFSPESLPILAAWDIVPVAEIKHISLFTPRGSLSFPLPSPARSQSRFDFDIRLLKRAEALGAKVITQAKVKDIGKGIITLENGELLTYTDLIMSAGRLFSASSPRYIGIKAHMQGIEIADTLEMYSLPGGYGGLSPLGDGRCNFTCLLRNDRYRIEDLPEKLFQIAPHLQKRLQGGQLVFDDWMRCQVPPFGIKKTPPWPHTYFIGDAAGTIPPASGLGLSLAVTSGYMAAEYALQGDSIGFQNAWRKKYSRIFAYGHLLHALLMRPNLLHSCFFLSKILPNLPAFLFRSTRYK